MSDTLYHSGAMRCNVHQSGVASIPFNAVGALPVFATREEAEADNETHGLERGEVGVMQKLPTEPKETSCDHQDCTTETSAASSPS